jgi:hypothetical protein
MRTGQLPPDPTSDPARSMTPAGFLMLLFSFPLLLALL